MLFHVFIYLVAFAGIWIGSGLAIGAVERLSKVIKISTFLVSFLILGVFTSVSELSVGINSVLEKDPEIFVGNLIGASIVLFLLIIPLLSLTGKEIRISKEFQGFNLPASLVVVALPVLLALDGIVSQWDAVVTMVVFGILVLAIQRKRSLLEKVAELNARATLKVGRELLKVVFGVVIIFIASRAVVEQTMYFSELLKLSPFVISLLLIGLGTNLPELSIVVRSIFMKNNQVAFGDYVGSAAFNTFLLGALTIFNGQPVYLTNSYVVSLLFLVVGLCVFYYVARTKNTISRLEGGLLLFIYILFLTVEVLIH